jgi:hypothetical protein
MRRRNGARRWRRLALGPLAALSALDIGVAVIGSRRPTPPPGVDPTQAPAAADRVIRPSLSAAWTARSARFESTAAAV